jgi:hypothetical protein
MSVHRTTAIALAVILAASGGTSRAADDDLSMSDARTIAAYPLTMDKVQRKFAVATDLARLSEADSGLRTQLQSVNESKDLNTQIKAFGAVPRAAASLQAHGISARDYILTTLAIAYAMIPRPPAEYRQASAPPDSGDVAASPEHVAFVQAHLVELGKLTQAIVQASKEAQR